MSMQSPDSVAFQENRVTLSCFDVGGGVYAMDVSHVREVARWQQGGLHSRGQLEIALQGVFLVRREAVQTHGGQGIGHQTFRLHMPIAASTHTEGPAVEAIESTVHGK